MMALFLVLKGRGDRVMILVLPSVKDSSSSLPQAAQMTSGKRLPSHWALILSFLLVQRGFLRLNILKTPGSAYSHDKPSKISENQRVLVIKLAHKQSMACRAKASIAVRAGSHTQICKSEAAAKECLGFLYQHEVLTLSLSAGREGLISRCSSLAKLVGLSKPTSRQEICTSVLREPDSVLPNTN